MSVRGRLVVAASNLATCSLPAVLMLVGGGCLHVQDRERAWVRHVIDDSSRGADGVRLADANDDGSMDIATGWEEGGLVRVCLNPGPERSTQRWPVVTVGEVGSPEDAVLVDLDKDGALDVVSSCEGSVKSIWIHWAPVDESRYLDPAAWTTETLPAARGVSQWMFCLPLQLDGEGGVDLVAGAKGDAARIGWFESPADPRNLTAWKWHPLYDAGWIMSLAACDVDGDGDEDVVASDRRGETRGCLWLENPGRGLAQKQPWQMHAIGAGDKEVMFLTLADLDRDGAKDVLVATRGPELIYLRREAVTWESFTIELPPGTGTGKAVRVADIDQDGRLDIVFTCERAADLSGVMWMSYRQAVTDAVWDAHDISGLDGVKYDLLELLDLDGDGDLDVITCEESRNLGVVWYENPTLNSKDQSWRE